MRELDVSVIRDTVARLCIEANTHLPADVQNAIRDFQSREDWAIARGVLENIVENFEIAQREEVPICQDTGMACVFLEVGQEVHFVGGGLYDAIHEGVRKGYGEGYLRKSVVAAGSWYEAPVLWAVENSITNGLSATAFGPDSICNRAQIVTFLYRAYAE